jgi:hypothetical protein
MSCFGADDDEVAEARDKDVPKAQKKFTKDDGPFNYIRETPAADKAALDAVMSGESRFAYQKRPTEGPSRCCGLTPIAELITTCALHLGSQIAQFLLITYFLMAQLHPMSWNFLPERLNNYTHQLELSLASQNKFMVPMTTQTLCAGNTSVPWVHRLMMFVLFAKVLPEFSNLIWYLYWTWFTPTDPNHDIEPKDEEYPEELAKSLKKELKAARTSTESPQKVHEDQCGKEENGEAMTLEEGEDWKATIETMMKAFAKDAQRYVGAMAANDTNEHGQYKWREEEKVDKEWKKRLVVLNVAGKSFKTQNIKNAEIGLHKTDFPLRIIYQEQDPVHYIGKFSPIWKLFTTCSTATTITLRHCWPSSPRTSVTSTSLSSTWTGGTR